MAVVLKKKVFAGTTPAAPQPSPVDTTEPIATAFEAAGRTVSQLAQVSGQLREIDQAEEARIEKARIKEKENQDRADATDSFTVDKGALGEKIVELKSRQQRGAKDITLEYDAFAKELFTKGRARLTSPEAQALYDEDARVEYLNSRIGIMTHERGETRKGQQASFSAAGDQSVRSGIADFDNPNTHAIEEDRIDDMAISMQEVSGWSPEQTKAWKDEKLSKMYEGIVKQWAIKDADTAALSYDVNKEKIAPEKRVEIEKLLKTENTNQKGKELAESIQAQTDDFEEQKRLARDEKDADISDNAYQRVVADNKAKIAAQKETDRLNDDDILTKILIIKDENVTSGEAESYRLATQASSGQEELKLRKIIADLYKVDPDKPIRTDDSHLTEVYTNIENGVYKSLENLRRETLGTLSKADQKEAEDHWQRGGLIGGIKTSEMRSSFEFFSGLKPEENTLAFMSVWRYVEKMTKSLPPGTTSVSSTQLNEWMQKAVVKEADENNFFSTDVRGLMHAEREELELTGTIDVDMTDEETEMVKSRIKAKNEERKKQGRPPYPITPKFIKKGFLNLKGVEESKRTLPRLIRPEEGGIVGGVGEAQVRGRIRAGLRQEEAERQRAVEETTRPFRGSEKPLTADEIRTTLAGEGAEITDEAAKALEIEQYPKRFENQIRGILDSELSKEDKQTAIENIMREVEVGVFPEQQEEEAE